MHCTIAIPSSHNNLFRNVPVPLHTTCGGKNLRRVKMIPKKPEVRGLADWNPAFSLFPRGLLEESLYQRPRRTPVAHSNLVTKMSTIKGLICKTQDKARLHRHRTVQYFFLSVRQKGRKQSAKTDRVAAETCLGRKLSRGLSPPSLPSLVSSSIDKIHKQRGP